MAWEDISAMAKNDGEAPVEFIFERMPLGPFFNFKRRAVFDSENGMDWGYLGSGPADAALNVLLYFCDGSTALRLYEAFEAEEIARLPQEGGKIPAGRVSGWLAAKEHERWAGEQGKPARKVMSREELDESLY